MSVLFVLPDSSKGFDQVPGSEKPANLNKNETITRYVDNDRALNADGEYDPKLDTGRYTAPEHVSEEQRAMASSDGKTEHVFKVVNPNIDTKESNAAPFFDKDGLGKQYEHEKTIGEMVDHGDLEYIGTKE